MKDFKFYMFQSTANYINYLKKNKWLGIIAAVFISVVVFFSLKEMAVKKQINEIFLLNVGAIFLICIILQLVRWCLERKEIAGYGRSPYIKGVVDMFANPILFTVCYIATFKSNYVIVAVGIGLSIFNLGRILKYRIYDDVFYYKIHRTDSQRYKVKENEAGHFLMRSMLDLLPRSYSYTAFSFTIFQLLFDADAFINAHPSNNNLIDFFYFNVVTMATIGYGDITPVSATAKLLCSIEIIFSTIILATILTTLIGVFQKKSEQQSN